MAESERRIIIVPSSDPVVSEPNDKLVAELIYCVADLYIRLGIPYEGFPICAAPIFDFAEQIGTRIRMNRIRRNMTQQKLAIMMHMDKSTISRNERGLSLTLDAIPQYAEQLGCAVHDLVPDFDYISDGERSFDKVIEEFRISNNLSNGDMESLLLKTALYLHENKGLTQEQAKRFGCAT